MQNIGDFVIHRKTRRIGKVVGYGHQIVDAVYPATLIVRNIKGMGLNRKKIVEDLTTAWLQAQLKEPTQPA